MFLFLNCVFVLGVVIVRLLKFVFFVFFLGCKFFVFGNGILMFVVLIESEKERESGRGGVMEGRKKVELW